MAKLKTLLANKTPSAQYNGSLVRVFRGTVWGWACKILLNASGTPTEDLESFLLFPNYSTTEKEKSYLHFAIDVTPTKTNAYRWLSNVSTYI